MALTVYFAKSAKRRNSTMQPTFSTSIDCVLKAPTSLDNPTFLVSAAAFDYNVAKYGDKYYFIEDIVSVRNGQWEVSCVIDVLATYKTEILASTQFVCYSSHNTSVWLPDTRVPLLKSATVSQAVTTLNFLFNTSGFYVISAVGKSGADTWAVDASGLEDLLDRVNSWADDIFDDVLAGNYPLHGYDPPQQATTYDFTTVEKALKSLSQMNALTGLAGNAYLDAPNCIRSCIWVPFFANFFTSTGGEIYLGAFPTGVTNAFHVKAEAVSRTASITIPWQYSDWRRAVCEEVYLYLPLVGMVSIPSDEIINESAINVEWSATATDGCIAYRLTAGNQVIGTYGANCAVNVPIGISQQASAGEIVQSVLQGYQRMVNAGTVSTPSPLSLAAATKEMKAQAVIGAYNTINTSLTRHNSCIGGIGGGAGVGLDLSAKCFTVAHPTAISPASMQATMGLPTMQPMALSTLTGYCQCANAHVSAPAMASELDAIDGYLNGGFYIE